MTKGDGKDGPVYRRKHGDEWHREDSLAVASDRTARWQHAEKRRRRAFR